MCVGCEKPLKLPRIQLWAGAVGLGCATLALLQPPFIMWFLLTGCLICYAVGAIPTCDECETTQFGTTLMPPARKIFAYGWVATPVVIFFACSSDTPTYYHVPILLVALITAFYGPSIWAKLAAFAQKH
ncbi:MAG: hypothetical protein Q3976_10370 [Corynebacterium sp.]|nr:hypothetical protein [Corynebacterium sp.]